MYFGINCCHSKDLLNWVNIGQVLGQKQVYIKGRGGLCTIERPKVVWNAKTKLFVMWFHLDSSNYGYRYVWYSNITISKFKHLLLLTHFNQMVFHHLI